MNDVDDLVRDYLPLAKSLARRFARGQFDWLRDDFTSAALEALWNAAESFDAERGWAFATWARLRIRGALIRRLQIERTRNRAAFCAAAPVTSDDGRTDDAVALVPDPGARADEVTERNEWAAKLLAALPGEEREVVLTQTKCPISTKPRVPAHAAKSPLRPDLSHTSLTEQQQHLVSLCTL